MKQRIAQSMIRVYKPQRKKTHHLTHASNEDSNQTKSSLSANRNFESFAVQNASSEDFDQGPVVQSTVSLTSSLVVKMLTVLVSIISKSQVFLLQMQKLLTFFQQKILAYFPYLMTNDGLNDIKHMRIFDFYFTPGS